MSDVAACHVLGCSLFPVQGGMWTGIITHNNGRLIILIRDLTRNYTCSLMLICYVLSKHVGAVKVF